MPHLFQENLSGDWIYPCTLVELGERLATIPQGHLDGIWAVGLARATHKDHAVNGRYFWGEKPTICLYSHRTDLRYKLPAHTRERHIRDGFRVERAYGMQVEKIHRRYWCYWSPELWKEFVLDYVLRHEIGHHLFERQQEIGASDGSAYHRNRAESFAEKYAQEHSSFHQLDLIRNPDIFIRAI